MMRKVQQLRFRHKPLRPRATGLKIEESDGQINSTTSSETILRGK